MSESIRVTISPKGETKIDAIGFTGTACQDATKKLREVLGNQTSEQIKPEMYACPVPQEVSLNQ